MDTSGISPVDRRLFLCPSFDFAEGNKKSECFPDEEKVRIILVWWSKFIHNQVFPLSALGEILPKTKVSVS